MNSKSIVFIFAMAVVALGVGPSFAQGAQHQVQGKKMTMATKRGKGYDTIEKILKTNCVGCHNAKNHPEKVDLSSYDALTHSGASGPIAIPGQPKKSSLITYVDGTKKPRMPLNKPPLSAADIATLTAWVQAGTRP